MLMWARQTIVFFLHLPHSFNKWSLNFGGVPERSNGADCKSVGAAFGGSNPSPPTLLNAEIAHPVERQLPKLQVAGSSPVFRSNKLTRQWSGFFILAQIYLE